MATTSLWHIEGRLKDLIDYVENPEKTKAKAPELQDIYRSLLCSPLSYQLRQGTASARY